MLSVFITSVLLVCQILLTAGPLTVMEAWASRGEPVHSDFSETAPEEERAGKFSEADEYLTAGKVSEDGSDGLFKETAADDSMIGETAADRILSDAAPAEEMNAEAAAAGAYPADESTAEAAAGVYPADESTAEAALPDEYAGDEAAAEAALPDEYTGDEAAAEAALPDEYAGDDTAAAEEALPDQYAGDDTAAEEYSADDFSENQDIADVIVPDDIAEGETLYEDNVTREAPPEEAPSEDVLSEESSAAAEEFVSDISMEDGDPEYVIPIELGVPNIDNDDLFAGYVCRELGVDEDFITDVSEPEDGAYADNDTEYVSSPAMNSNYASTRLDGYTKKLYDCLLNEVRRTAAGERTSTQFQITAESLGLDQTWWSAADLGVDSVTAVNTIGNTYIPDSVKAKHRQIIGIDFTAVIRALVSDCPYDMYWYDKTVGTQTPKWFNKFEYAEIDGEMKIRVKSDSIYIVKMPVSSDYSASGSAGTFVVNPEIGTSVATARDNALAIVDKYSGCTDYQKLDAYRDEILKSNSYNYAAINENAPYGNPWQLIYALDGDADTKVVCEGYSKAFQYLCDLSTFSDIFKECISVTGMLGDPGSVHMWNIVALQDGTNYLVDLTNCDVGMIGQENGGRGLFMVGTGSSDWLKRYAVGNVDEGYKLFNDYAKGTLYRYDQFSFSRFGKDILTLSEGKILLTDAKITVEVPQGGIGYDGTEKKPGVTVSYKNRTFVEGSDYKVEYFNNIDVGKNTAQVLITALGGGHCLESAQKTFSIVKGEQKLTASDLDIALQDQAVISVGGADGELSFTSSDSSIVQVDEKDGTVTGLGAGTAIVTVNAAETDKYNAARIDIKVRVRIPILASGTMVSVASEDLVYDGSEKTPEVTIVHGNGNTLVNGTDYTLSYSNNINAGTDTGVITITGEGDYSGIITEHFTIGKAPQPLSVRAHASRVAIGKGTLTYVTGAEGNVTYSSSDPDVAGVSSGGTVTGKKIGEAVITVVSAETENYLETSEQITINVVPAATSSIRSCNRQQGILLTWEKVEGAIGYDIYRGSSLIRTIQGGSVESFQDNDGLTNGITYSYRIYARGTTGVSTLYRSAVICRLTRPSIVSLNNPAPGKMRVTWERNSKATKYQVQYSQFNDFRSSATVNVMGASSLKTVIGGLSRNRIRYVRLRTCRTVGQVTYTSMWSMVRTVKITK